MKKNEFTNGLKDSIPICLGYFSVSMAFGLTAVLSGFPLWATVLTSFTNLTSAGQFAGVNIILSCGKLIELMLTTIIINMRYFLMSLSVSQKVDPSTKLWQRFLISFGITDEIFAVSISKRKALTTSYMLGLIIPPVFGWTTGTITGAIATSVMPKVLSEAMGIALYAMFIAIIIPPSRKNKSVFIAVIVSVLLSVIFEVTPIFKIFSQGWSVIVISVIVSAFCASVFPLKEVQK